MAFCIEIKEMKLLFSYISNSTYSNGFLEFGAYYFCKELVQISNIPFCKLF